MRDTIQTLEYFDEGIAFMQKCMEEDIDSVHAIHLHEGRAMQVHSLRERSVMLCLQRYSRGDDLTAIKPSVDQMLKAFHVLSQTMPTLTLTKNEQKMWANLGLSKLFDYLWSLAFVVGLKYPQASVVNLLTHIGHAGDDGLLDRIAVLLGDSERPVMQQSKFEREFSSLIALMDAPAEQRPALLKIYVEGWYKRMRRASWHNTQQGEAYCGYWCLEGVLVAMLLNIDDSAVQGHIHYPADLVNYYRAAA